MLLDAIANPRPKRTPQEPGTVRTAGLLNLLDAAQALGGKWADAARFAESEGYVRDGREMWKEFRSFRDPFGDWTVDTGPTWQPNMTLPPRFGSLDRLQQNAPTIREYLGDHEMTREFGPQLDNYRIGFAPQIGADAGVIPPTTQMGRPVPGVLAFDARHSSPEKVAPMFEHEFQHILQDIIDSPTGTMPDDTPKQLQYLSMLGTLPDGLMPRLRAAAKVNNATVNEQAYLNTFGEAEARLAADRLDPTKASKRPYLDDYVTSGGYFADPDALWRMRPSEEAARRRGKKVGTP